MRATTTLLLCASSLSLASAGCEPSDAVIEAPPTWYLVWSDEFEGEGEVDPSKWTHDIGTGENGWGNGELQFYTDRPLNVGRDGQGRLALTALREDFAGGRYTSARIKTQGLFAQQYGRIEARIQLPEGQGVWPAFWMLGADLDEVGWPRTGEIDIMEFRGSEPDLVHGSLHGPGYSGGAALTKAKRVPRAENFVERFHTFAVEWDPARIRWFVDDENYHSVGTGPAFLAEGWVFDKPFFILLNVAVGGTFVGPPGPDTSFPASMLVDYVRVFSRRPPG